MMSEISYHQQQYIRHQKREKKLVLFLRIFILLFFLHSKQLAEGQHFCNDRCRRNSYYG